MTNGTVAQGVAKRAGSRPRSIGAIAVCTALAIAVLSMMVFVPVNGRLPGDGLDESWGYALADAAARHRPFGRDVVFTFGPLAPLYSHIFLPSQRAWVYAGNAALVAAFCAGAVALCRRRTLALTLLIPLLLANVALADAFFLVLPWLIVPLAARARTEDRWHRAGLLALSAVLGPLLLIKGTLAVPVIVSVGTAALALSRRSLKLAAALPCAAVASAAVTWTAAGQSPAGFLDYARWSGAIAAGYTDAMSQVGDPLEIAVYGAGALLLLGTQVVPRRAPLLPTLAAATILFVAFKAGFVRHDGHAMIAASSLLLLGLLVLLARADLAAGVGFLASLACWSLITAPYMSVAPAADWARLIDGLRRGAAAVSAAASDPDAFRRAFEANRARVAAEAALPPTAGTVDLYADSQGALLASGRDYAPRPVPQSYSAYTPALAALNANHLEGSRAPDSVFFALEPVDRHYPSLDDGPSWPALLSRYRFRTFAGRYAVLDRAAGAPRATMGPPLESGRFRFGAAITLPRDVPLLWARMAFHPTLLGRAVSTLFKLPPLLIEVTLPSGVVQQYRLVAGMAEAGFLLSPIVTSVQDFVALRSTDADALAGERVASITVHSGWPSRLWGQDFEFSLSALTVSPDAGVDSVALGHMSEGPPVDGLPAKGACVIDAVGGRSATLGPVATAGHTATVTGWGLVSPEKGEGGGDLRLALTEEGHPTLYAPAERITRPDVDRSFHLTRPTLAGFTARLNLASIAGPATLRVVQDGPDGPAVCGAPVVLRPGAAGEDGRTAARAE